jgi:carbamoyltransferase
MLPAAVSARLDTNEKARCGRTVIQPVLGLGGSDHDFSAAIIEEGVIAVAVEDERIQGIKHANTAWHAHPARDAAYYCLDAAGLAVEELAGIFCCDDLDRPTPWLDWKSVTFVNHHTAHAAASYFMSGTERATLLVIDGHGSPLVETPAVDEVETISIGSARQQSLSVESLQTGVRRRTSSTWHYATNNSIGWFYEIITSALGFGPTGQGKAMGLAAYGTPAFLDEMSAFVEIPADGRFRFDPYGGIWEWLTEMLATRPSAMQLRADLAYAAQEIFADAIVVAANEAYRRYPSPVLCFGGGCALNTLANSMILQNTPFERISIFPAAGDNGLSVGAAFYGAHVLLGQPRRGDLPDWRARAVYTGREHGTDVLDEALAEAPVAASRPADLVRSTARALADGETVAICRGRSEIGPRALGNRSLLALPSTTRMRDHINLNIKERESYRPLAPVVPIEHVTTYFEGIEESPYMLLVAHVRDEFRGCLAAVTHVDGTARVQTVRATDNPFLYRLLELIGELIGVPVLLNTSLNSRGKPIVETPSDALALFTQRPIDLLILGDRMVRKYTPWAPLGSLAESGPARITRNYRRKRAKGCRHGAGLARVG